MDSEGEKNKIQKAKLINRVTEKIFKKISKVLIDILKDIIKQTIAEVNKAKRSLQKTIIKSKQS